MEKIEKFLKDEEGVTAIEYALLAAVIALGIIVAVGLAKDAIVNVFNKIAASLAASS